MHQLRNHLQVVLSAIDLGQLNLARKTISEIKELLDFAQTGREG